MGGWEKDVGCELTSQGCTTGGLDWSLGRISSQRGVVRDWKGLPSQSATHTYKQLSRGQA